jgi:hypothetical protein
MPGRRKRQADHAAYIRELLWRVRAGFTGYVMQEGFSEGLHADGWARPKMAFASDHWKGSEHGAYEAPDYAPRRRV